MNLDCDYGKKILEADSNEPTFLTLVDGNAAADFKAKSICLTSEGTSFELSYQMVL